ncbi:D-alanyl-D-alanine carboxypeptidase, partial [Streptomyces sp. A7024]|nr:D-alanyl-D-alanine carboxypeptidase [Streptomyces coryli]
LPPRPTAAPTAGAAAAQAASPPSGTASPPGEAAPAGDTGLPAYEQTKQQPLPPYEEKRPLDLLAQLTNTPPPAETPVRTIVRRFKIWTPLVALVVVVLGVIQLVRPLPEPTLSLTAKESYEFEGGAPEMPWPGEGQAVVEVEGLGRIGESGKEKPVPIASVAKVMTAYLMLKEHPVKGDDPGVNIPMDQQAEDDAAKGAQGESVVNVNKGDKLSQREALQAIMVASANNVARQIARWDAGSEKAFVKKMNDTAKELGMTNTKYTDPSGLNATTVSTASDQVKLGMEAMKDPLFREVVLQPQYKDSNGDTHQNYNRLVPVNGVRGIKTGTTTKAGGNFVFAAEKKVGGTTQRIVGAVFGQHEAPIIDTVMARGQELITAAQGILTDMRVVKKGDVVGYVDDGLGTQVPVVATKDVNAVGWSGLKVSLKIGDGGKTIPNAAEAGDKVGELTMGGGQGEVSVPVALKEDLKEPGAGAKLTRLG